MRDVRLPGPVEVHDEQRPLPLGGRKRRALLAALLLRSGEPVVRARLIDDLWGERPPQTARNSLHNQVPAREGAYRAGVSRRSLGDHTCLAASSPTRTKPKS